MIEMRAPKPFAEMSLQDTQALTKEVLEALIQKSYQRSHNGGKIICFKR